MWKQIFSVQFFNRYKLDQCPLLIGILPIFRKKTKTVNTFDYWFETLMKSSTISRTKEKINSKNLLNELNHFNNEFNKTKLGLVSVLLFQSTIYTRIIFYSHLIFVKRLVFHLKFFLKLLNIFHSMMQLQHFLLI